MKYPTKPNNYRTSGKTRENHPNAKLTEKQVQEIRTLGSQGVSTSALVERFNMSKSAIHSILTNRTWKNTPLPEDPPDPAI